MKRSILTALAVSVLLVLAIVPAALAHSFIDHCTPDSGATLTQPPTQLLCTFTEAIDVKQTRITVLDARSNTVDNGDLKADPNDTKGVNVILTLNPARITGGQYTVRWQTVSADGDPTDGQFQFAVNAQPAPSISIVSPNDSSTFATAPADIPVTVNIANFAVGQGARHWVATLNGTQVADVTSGNSTVLKGVAQGDYGFKVLLEDGTTVVATAGMHLGVGSTTMAMTPAPATAGAATPASMATAMPAASTPVSSTTAPSSLPKTGAGSDASALPVFVLALVVLALMMIGVGRIVRRAS